MHQNPPYGYEVPSNSAGKFTYYTYGPRSNTLRPGGSIHIKMGNKYNNHAKSGFKYWYQDKPGVPCKY